jgi:hypothetical protein
MVSLARRLKVLDLCVRRYHFTRAIARVRTRPSKIYPIPLVRRFPLSRKVHSLLASPPSGTPAQRHEGNNVVIVQVGTFRKFG